MYLDACTRPVLMVGSDRVSKRRMKRMIDVSEINMVTTFCHLLEVCLGVFFAMEKRFLSSQNSTL